MDESTIDREAVGQLAKALTFICGADHPTVAAMKIAALEAHPWCYPERTRDRYAFDLALSLATGTARYDGE
jgi:hypothetical protein